MKTFFCSKKANQSGFAIILVMGLLLVAAAVAATMVARQENETTWAPIKGTQTQLADVQQALIAYQRQNHRLPLPANRENVGALHVETDIFGDVVNPTVPGAAKTAIEAGATMVETGAGIAVVVNPGDPAGSEVAVGTIPTQTLGLPRSAAEDKNGRLLTYAVTLAAANPTTFEEAKGTIDVVNAGGGIVAKDQTFLIISHGKDGAGAYNAKSRFRGRDCSGSMNTPPPANKDGGELQNGGEIPDGYTPPPVTDFGNCDENDATFIANDVNLVAGNSFFDDQMLKGGKDTAALTMSRPCPAQTVNWGVGNACTAQIPEPGLMHVGSSLEPRELELTNTSPGATGTVTVQCDNGTIVKTDEVCTVNNNACPLPWGGTINHGESVDAYMWLDCESKAACLSEKRVCNNGVLSGSYTQQKDCRDHCAAPLTCALPWGGTIGEGDSVTAYQASTYNCGDAEPASELRMCLQQNPETPDLILTGSYQYPSTVSVPNPCPAVLTCDLPWGGTIAENESVTAYQASTYNCGDAEPASELRMCLQQNPETPDVILTGSYQYPSTVSVPNPCPVGTGCTTPWGSSVADGVTVTAYKDVPCSVLCGAESDCCEAQSRACNLGQWVQTSCVGGGAEVDKCSPAPFGAGFSLQTCPYIDATAKGGSTPRICPLPTASCNLPWGGTLAHGGSVTAYLSNSVACGANCASETRTCTNGTLSGTYTHQNCSAAACSSCNLPWGGTLANGASVQAFSTSSVACGNSCPASTTRTCNNGVLSGSGNFASCSVDACGAASCALPWGGTLAHNASVTAYQTSSVACGQTCASQSRTCSNGTLSGTYTNQSCSAAACAASCTLDGVTVPHGQGRTFYDTDSPACGSCNGEWRVCDNGTLSGNWFSNRANCTDGPACGDGSCTGPDGSNIANGATKRYFDPNSGICNCLWEDRTCSNGVLGGNPSYTNNGCAKILCGCVFGTDGFGNPGHVSIGDSVTAYQSDTVPDGSSCTSETRTCNAVYGGHPVLSGSYEHESCAIEPPAVCDAAAYWAGGGTCPNPYNFYWGPMPDGSNACLAMCPPQPCNNPFGGTVNPNDSITSYTASSVPHGQSCDSVAVYSTCSPFNQTLSPAPAAHASCTVEPPPPTNPCTNPAFMGGTTPHGGSITTYHANSGCAAECFASREISECNNGAWDVAPASFGFCTDHGHACD